MSRSCRPSPAPLTGALVLLASLLLGGAAAACSGPTPPVGSAPGTAGDSTMVAATPAASDTSPVGIASGGAMGDSTDLPSPDEIAAAWATSPVYVHQHGAATEEAYAFAVARPDILQWMPCYCGCAAMEHRSNLECFLERRDAGGPIAFEEHASYCDICVQTALKAKQMLAQGATLTQMRAAVDEAFGGRGAPGTPTELPPG